VIVVPNKNTKNYLVDQENVDADKLVEINFGFHLREYELSGSPRVHIFREQYDIPENSFVIGIASRFTHFKGLQYSLPALTNFLDKNPQGILVMAVTGEEVPPELDRLIKNISRIQLRMAPRGCDMPAFYNSLNVFIHTPIDETVESFGLVYVESFAAEVATIVTLSGIAKDICVDGENCLVVDFCNTIEIENSLDKLFIDKNLRSKLAEKARQSVSHLTMTKMRHEYRQLLAPPNKF
jgi:glycosyltransferase involved in cell wall biosynthesis